MTLAYGPAAGQWQRLHPREARPLLDPIRLPWWIAGGWALDLYTGRQGRAHKDLDVGILRRDARAVLAALEGWEFFEARDGELYGPLTGAPREGVNSLWGRQIRSSEWVLELLLDDAEGGEWVYRRDHRLRRPLPTVIRYDAERTPYLAPEIQLLYKSSHIRAEDQLDFERVSGLLEEAARQWLYGALRQLDPQHRWLPALRAADRAEPS